MLIRRLALATVFFFQLNLVAGGQMIGWGTFYSSTITNDPPDDLGDVVALAGGTYTSLALRSDGTVASWGPELAPPGLSNIRAISAGGGFYLALQTNGTIVAWGRNDHGQTNVPSDLTNVVAISASMDLLHWDPVWTNSAAAGVIQLIDAGAIGAPQRYYRLEEMK